MSSAKKVKAKLKITNFMFKKFYFFLCALFPLGVLAQTIPAVTINQDCSKNGVTRHVGNGLEGGHDFVDLGLSVMWATCNVGATTPEGYGYYFAWGETRSKNDYTWSTYKYCKGNSVTMTKYCTSGSYGTVDNKTVLELEDDAAHVNWGGNWRMPTTAEQDELRSQCTWVWTTINNVKGYKITSKKNGNSIFLPAAGYRSRGNISNVGANGYYLSSSLSTGNSCCVYNLYFYSGNVDWDSGNRNYGRSVRPVCP